MAAMLINTQYLQSNYGVVTHCYMQGLSNLGLHPAYTHLENDYPVADQSLMRRLARTLSTLTHWAPVLGEVAFLPALAFPFVQLFKADLESCFEVCLSRPDLPLSACYQMDPAHGSISTCTVNYTALLTGCVCNGNCCESTADLTSARPRMHRNLHELLAVHQS